MNLLAVLPFAAFMVGGVLCIAVRKRRADRAAKVDQAEIDVLKPKLNDPEIDETFAAQLGPEGIAPRARKNGAV